MKKLLPLLLLLLCLPIIFNSCACIVMPKKQKVTINTSSANSTIYVNNEEFGNGQSVKAKTKKEGIKQIIIKTPEYKDTYATLVPTHRPAGFWFCLIPDVYFAFVGLVFDIGNPKNMSYDKINNAYALDKLVFKKNTDKYIEISNLRLEIKNKQKDIRVYTLNYKKDIGKEIEAAELKQEMADIKAEAKKKKKKAKVLNSEEVEKLNYDDTKFSYNVYKTLKTTGFIDTVNKVFSDNNNTLVLEGVINKVFLYEINSAKKMDSYYKSKLQIKWYIKNTYNEILDSIETKTFSGDFIKPEWVLNADEYNKKQIETFEKIYADAIDISYLRLHNDPKLKKYINQETNFKTADNLLTIKGPTSIVSKTGDASAGSVIVKTKDGHGSGFAISNDGYIITNYHVIAGRLNNKVNSVKVINSAGEELEATVVRVNKYRDVALLKVNDIFEKAFKCSSVKSFKNMQDVYTIGAPKSIELGQSITTGIISNERKSNNNNLLQLSMSVNGGNSGGPLFDTQGNLHGVIVSKLVGQNTEGVSFAIPGYLLQEYLNINFN